MNTSDVLFTGRNKEEDNDPHWTGWTRSLSHIPLQQIRHDGYDVQELEDERGKYWQIIKNVLNS